MTSGFQFCFVLIAVMSSCVSVDVIGSTRLDGGLSTLDGGPRECTTAACSGHGSCRVENGYAQCDCEAGYVERRSALQCVRSSEGGCRTSLCPVGQACSFETGACVVLPTSSCFTPVSSGSAITSGSRHADCAFDGGPQLQCRAGQVCVDKLRGSSPIASCEGACNPCTRDCARGDYECVALPGGGGFCSFGAIRGLGEPCEASTCAPGLICSFANVCATACVPDETPPSNFSDFSVGLASANCAPGELCRLDQASIAGSRYRCDSNIGRVGERCPFGGVCAAPAICVGLVGVCSHDCSITPCPAGSACATINIAGFIKHICIADGALVRDSLCAEDRNCPPWLVCATTTIGKQCREP